METAILIIVILTFVNIIWVEFNSLITVNMVNDVKSKIDEYLKDKDDKEE